MRFFFAVLLVSDIWTFCFTAEEVSNSFLKMYSAGDCSGDTCWEPFCCNFHELEIAEKQGQHSTSIRIKCFMRFLFKQLSSFTLWNCRPSTDCQNIRKIHASKKNPVVEHFTTIEMNQPGGLPRKKNVFCLKL